ncbi:MAG: diguanylate cyclase domain-containing protein [Nitrospinaceae bacterium]
MMATKTHLKILLVDDSPEDRQLYKRLLSRSRDLECFFLETDTGEDGLELCRAVNPDCILLDYILTDTDGLEFLSNLKKMGYRGTAIMLTGQGDETVAVLAMKEGASDYLVKDFLTPATLQGAVLKAVKNKRPLPEADDMPPPPTLDTMTPEWKKMKKDELIKEIQSLKQKLASSSNTDPLTGLPNRRDMTEKLYYEKFRFERSRKSFALIWAEIDDFRKIIDTQGPETGNHLLVQVANLLDKNSRKQDVVCRWSDERFLLLLPETSLKGATFLAEKFCALVESEKFHFRQKEIPITVSFGVGVYDDENLEIDYCIRQADECPF